MGVTTSVDRVKEHRRRGGELAITVPDRSVTGLIEGRAER